MIWLPSYVVLGMKIPFVLLPQWAFSNARVDIAGRGRAVAVDSRDIPVRSLPELTLGEDKERATAGRADPLVMFRGVVGHLILIAQRLLHCDQIGNVHLRGKGRSAATAVGGCFPLAHIFVEAHPNLCGALKDVKKFAKGQPQKRADDRNRVQNGDKVIGVTLHPSVAGREHNAGEADAKEEDERQKILGEHLQSSRPLLAHTAAHGQHHPGNDNQRRPDQPMKGQKGENRAHREGEGGKAKDIGAVKFQICGDRLEMQPAKDKGKGNPNREYAAPHN